MELKFHPQLNIHLQKQKNIRLKFISTESPANRRYPLKVKHELKQIPRVWNVRNSKFFHKNNTKKRKLWKISAKTQEKFYR